MKDGIHPQYGPSRIICGCGAILETQATRPEVHIELCSNCHPFYTGKQKISDVAGRIERFNRRYGRGKTAAPAESAEPAEPVAAS